MITNIKIENFKGIRERLCIDFAPITLFFGANSAGKSTVLDALDYLRAVLNTQSATPELLSDGYKKNFVSLLHQDAKIPEIKIEVTCEVSESDEDFFTIRGHVASDDAESFSTPTIYSPFGLLPTPVSLEVTIAQRSLNFKAAIQEGAQIKSLRIGYCGEFVLQISESTEPTANKGEFQWKVNLNHELLQSCTENGGTLEFICQSNFIFPSKADPPLSEGFFWGLSDPRDVPNGELANSLNALSSAAIQIVKSRLNDTRQIGSLRSIPDTISLMPPSSNPNHWQDGTAAWESLAYVSEDFLIDVNSWLIRLGTKCIVTQQQLVDLNDVFEIFEFSRSPTPIPAESILRLKLNALRRVGLVRVPEEQNSILAMFDRAPNRRLLSPADFGTGVSQLVPIVVASRDASARLWSIMQPELHLHPRTQAELGDLFIDGKNMFGHQFVLETHSENLLLRILRRVRETYKSGKKSELSLETDDVAVYFFQQQAGCTKATKLDIDINGDFIQPWPDDFFEIDFYERFS